MLNFELCTNCTIYILTQFMQLILRPFSFYLLSIENYSKSLVEL